MITAGCHVISARCHVITARCHVITARCHVISARCHVISVRCYVISARHIPCLNGIRIQFAIWRIFYVICIAQFCTGVLVVYYVSRMILWCSC